MVKKKSSKKWIIIPIVVIILIGLGIGGYFLLFRPNYSVSGKVTEVANKKPVADVTVSANGKEVKTDKNGDYKLEKLKKEITLTFKQPSKFENVEPIKVNFKARIKSENITKDVALVTKQLTVDEAIAKLKAKGFTVGDKREMWYQLAGAYDGTKVAVNGTDTEIYQYTPAQRDAQNKMMNGPFASADVYCFESGNLIVSIHSRDKGIIENIKNALEN